jgi:hypothetical protein
MEIKMSITKQIVKCFEEAKAMLWDGVDDDDRHITDKELYICCAIQKTSARNSTQEYCTKLIADFLGFDDGVRNTAFTWYTKNRNCDANRFSVEVQNFRFELIDKFIKEYS